MHKRISRLSKYALALCALAAVWSGVGALRPAWAAGTTKGEPRAAQLRRINEMFEGYPVPLRDIDGKVVKKGSPSSFLGADVLGDSALSPEGETERETRRNYSQLSFLLASDRTEDAQKFVESLRPEERGKPPIMTLEANLLLKTQRSDEALVLCRRIVEKRASDPDPLLFLARILSAKGDTNGAIEALEKAHALAPENRAALETLEKAYREQLARSASLEDSQRILDKMEKVYREIVEIFPGQRSAPYLVVLSRILERRGEGREAMACMEKVVLYQPGDVEKRIALARYQEKFGTDRQAPLQTLRRALIVDPEYPELGSAIAEALEHAGGQTTALDFYKGVAEEYPGRDDIQLQYAALLLSDRKSAEAIEVLKASLALHPYSHGAERYGLLVQALGEQGRPEEAEPYLRKAIDNAYGEQKGLLSALLVAVYEQAKRIEEAVALLEGMAAKDPRDVALKLSLADLYCRSGNVAKAGKIADEVAAEGARDAETLYDLALLEWDLGRHADAEKRLSAVVDLKPDFIADVYNSLGYLFAEQGIKLDQALELVEKALKLKPQEGYILDSLGWVYFKKGEFDKAIEQLRNAAQIEKGDPTVREHLGEAYLAKGNKDQALVEFRDALTLATEESQSEKIKKRIETLEKPR